MQFLPMSLTIAKKNTQVKEACRYHRNGFLNNIVTWQPQSIVTYKLVSPLHFFVLYVKRSSFYSHLPLTRTQVLNNSDIFVLLRTEKN